MVALIGSETRSKRPFETFDSESRVGFGNADRQGLASRGLDAGVGSDA